MRTLSVLGRISNLPTVPSNCLAGWLLGGAGDLHRLGWLCLGAILIYTGGMFLNDAVDADWDRRHRPERPIPSNQVTRRGVFLGAFGLMLAGGLVWLAVGQRTALLGLALIVTVVTYDWLHKRIAFAPVLMALCRALLYLAAAAAGANGLTQPALWASLAIAAYIAGLSFFARRESVPDRSPLSPPKLRLRWPALLLLAPVGLALGTRAGLSGMLPTQVAMAVFILWTAWCLSQAFTASQPSLGRCVSGLLAGIPLADALAASSESWLLVGIFATLFLLARLSQRFAPAT